MPKPFAVVYADNPWQFLNRRTGGTMKSGSAQKYPILPLPAIQQLPIAPICQPNAALFLWVPSRLKFSHGLTTALAWDFPHYEATIYWQKTGKLGMGFWFRGQVEELLVFTRGSVAPFRCQRPNIISCPAAEHSTKPDEFRCMIEEATRRLPGRRLELFARKVTPGWVQVGHGVTGQDIRADLRGLWFEQNVAR